MMDPSNQEAVTFINHLGDKYIWPFELCTSFDTVRPLIEETYSLLHEQDRVDDVKHEKYEIQTENGDIILPSVWGHVVKPASTIRISFPALRSRLDIEETTFEFSPLAPGVSGGDEHASSEGTDSEDDLDSQSSSETESEPPEPVNMPETLRVAVMPVDADGNRISFAIDTSYSRRPTQQINGIASHDDSMRAGAKADSPETQVETLRITMATAAEAETRNIIQLHNLPGPENAHLRESVGITWHHIPASRLDFTRFRNVCLALPGLSDRLQMLVRAILKKIEEHNIKAFLDGLFIEPGTVLRADEKGQSDSQSVIFSCIPYLDLNPPATRPSTTSSDRLFPLRTLMQSYYPYEPVRDRDKEQAYAIFSSEPSKNLINVPNLWVMNIGPDIVVSCGHKPLAQNLVKSIELVRENLEQLGMGKITESSLTKIRLTDREGRVLVFPLKECRTYFQLEQKIKELRYTARSNLGNTKSKLVQTIANSVKRVVPGMWPGIVRRTDLIFIDLAMVEDDVEKDPAEDSITKASSKALTSAFPSSVPPFFAWPFPAAKDVAAKEGGNTHSFMFAHANGSTSCLEHAEKTMMSETIADWETVNDVDKSFTTTAFYQSLPEDTYNHVWKQFPSLMRIQHQDGGIGPNFTQHQLVINTQFADLGAHAMTFLETVHATFTLFVNDVNKSTMLRKVWGAMYCIHQIMAVIETRGAVEYDPEEYSNPSWKPPGTAKRGWFIRNDFDNPFVPAPQADKKFKRAVQRCRRCQSSEPFDSAEAALIHLQKHVKVVPQDSQGGNTTSSSAPPGTDQTMPGLTPEPNLKEWVINFAQAKREETNAGVLAIFVQACKTAEELLLQAKEIAEGVQNEDGKLSDLYHLPHRLVEAFREITVFYLAVERALHYTEKSYHEEKPEDANSYEIPSPFSEPGLDVLKRFGEGARRSLLMARGELCDMVAPPVPMDVFHHISLGPEYVCAWLMRRLLVKPLEQRLTAGDMYRAFLSTMQFQVNHRPSKRLLRSINFLQEEIRVLVLVNTWQTKLVQNYSQVLDDATYRNDIPARRALFPYERLLLRSCLDNLTTTREEYNELIRRCGPLSDSTKQSLEITEEDHGKAIMVFTTVTVIFLPLSFVTSYLGMNTNDIRNMNNQQSLFWIIAIPLTLATMAACLFISYKGASLRDQLSTIYRATTGKEDRSTSARGISVAQRKRASKLQSDTSSIVDNSTLADDAEYASPTPEPSYDEYSMKATMAAIVPNTGDATIVGSSRIEPELRKLPIAAPRSRLMVQSYADPVPITLTQDYARPTWIRLEKRFVEEDSLRYYGYTYDTDPADPNFFLIKQELSSGDTANLFEHTKQLREGGGRRRVRIEEHPRMRLYDIKEAETYELDNNDMGRVPGYTWHKKRSRRRTPRMNRGGPRGMMWREQQSFL